MASIDVRHIGDYIREQRGANGISVRQLAKLAGVSNPYLSQIERGLRKPSAEILQQLAKALRISAEALYVQAGILEQRMGDGLVVDAVLVDEGLNERQKQVLVEIYDSFRRENAGNAPVAADDGVAVSVVTAAGTTEPDAPEQVEVAPTPRSPHAGKPARRSTTRPTAPSSPAVAADTTDASGGPA